MSIRDHGFRVMELRTLDFDMEDIRVRQARPDVLELAKSRQRIALHPITIDAKTKRLVAGRDRLAADLLNKVQRAPVRLVEGTNEEMLDIEVEENLHRRADNRDELIARRVKSVVAEVTVQLPDTVSVKSPGRPKTQKGEAREKVARELGTTPDAVRKAESRAAKPATEIPAGAAMPPPIALKGKSTTAGFLDKVREVQAAIDVADKAARAVQAALSRLDNLPFPRARLQGLRERAHALAADMRAMRPRSLCLGHHGKTPCQLCGDAGWLGSDADTIQEASGQPTPVPPSTGNQGSSKGTGATAEKGTHAPDAVGPPKPAPVPKKVKILDENDKPIDVTDEEDEAF